MTLQDWFSNGWLKKHKSGAPELKGLLAKVDLDIAEAMKKETSLGWRLAIAFNACLGCATIALRVSGYEVAEGEAEVARKIQSLQFTLGCSGEMIRSLDLVAPQTPWLGGGAWAEVTEAEVGEAVGLARELRKAVIKLLESTYPKVVAQRVKSGQPAQVVKKIKARLAGVKRGRQFIDYHESGAYARELEELVAEIGREVEDPRVGVDLVAAFMETDSAVLGRADDSDGSIGDVYSMDAADLFVAFASACGDEEWLYETVLRLYEGNEYRVRDPVLGMASDFLSDVWLRRLVDELWTRGSMGIRGTWRNHWFGGVEMLARQLKDAPLFERARTADRPILNAAACLDIAEVYFEAGDTKTALVWLDRAPPDDMFHRDKRERLRLRIARELGDEKMAKDTAWCVFREDRCEETLALLLEVVGQDERERIVEGEVRLILNAPELEDADVDFLLEMHRIHEAERYLTVRHEQLDGDRYWQLLAWAKKFESDKRWRIASLIYRALLNSILGRGKSKYYSYGVKYLRKLDQLAPKVIEWGGLPSHDEYKLNLQLEHKRKFSFWQRYEL